MIFKIELKRADNYSLFQRKLWLSILKWEDAFNSNDFREQILNWPTFDLPLTNDQILRRILGCDSDNSNNVAYAKIKLTLLNSNSSSTIGYTTGSVVYTFKNQFFNHHSGFLAGHYAHEFCHLLGFPDPPDLQPHNKQKNVPYVVGDLVTQIASQNYILTD